MKYKWQIGFALIVVFVVLLGIYVRGWQELRFDPSDEAVGKHVIFNVPMVKVSPIPKQLSGKLIASNYDGRIIDAAKWSPMSWRYKDETVLKVSCEEVFLVKQVIFREAKGILERGFSAASIKYYVLTTDRDNRTYVVYGGDYESYARLADASGGGIRCREFGT